LCDINLGIELYKLGMREGGLAYFWHILWQIEVRG